MNADAAQELPVIIPLIVAADIADDIRIDRRQLRIDVDPSVLDTGEKPPGFVLVQGVIELDDGIEGRRGKRGFRY